MTNDLQLARDTLISGGLCAIPTETVYGLAGNALDASAAIRIFEAKARPAFDPLIVHIDHIDRLSIVVSEISEAAMRLAERFWPGPLTLILPRTDAVPDIVTSGLYTVGIRIPAHPLTRELLSLLPFPLAAPSANPFGYISPTTAQHVMDQLGGRIPMILDGGPCTIGIESTIVDCTGDIPKILRLGGLAVEMIREVAGPVEIALHSASNPAAPGMLTAHYAPRKRLVVGDPGNLIHQYAGTRTAVLGWSKLPVGAEGKVLSATGDLHEAARNLFASLRELDASEAELLIAEPAPDHGLGRAINDRLQRATAGSSDKR